MKHIGWKIEKTKRRYSITVNLAHFNVQQEFFSEFMDIFSAKTQLIILYSFSSIKTSKEKQQQNVSNSIRGCFFFKIETWNSWDCIESTYIELNNLKLLFLQNWSVLQNEHYNAFCSTAFLNYSPVQTRNNAKNLPNKLIIFFSTWHILKSIFGDKKFKCYHRLNRIRD